MNDKIKGLVLKTQDYKENDLMLQVLTEDKGILSFIGKASKKITAKQHFYEGCLYEFMIDYRDNKTIYSIHGSILIKPYYDLNNTKLFSLKNILFETVLKSKELYELEMYDNLLFVLENINDDNKYLLSSLFISYMNRLHGVTPNVDECVICGNKKVAAISNNLGGFLCLDHINGEAIQEVDTLKRFRLISKATFKDYPIIEKMVYDLSDFKLLIEFFEVNTSIVLKSYDFYTKVIC